MKIPVKALEYFYVILYALFYISGNSIKKP
jgi:hypothetical protein